MKLDTDDWETRSNLNRQIALLEQQRVELQRRLDEVQRLNETVTNDLDVLGFLFALFNSHHMKKILLFNDYLDWRV